MSAFRIWKRHSHGRLAGARTDSRVLSLSPFSFLQPPLPLAPGCPPAFPLQPPLGRHTTTPPPRTSARSERRFSCKPIECRPSPSPVDDLWSFTMSIFRRYPVGRGGAGGRPGRGCAAQGKQPRGHAAAMLRWLCCAPWLGRTVERCQLPRHLVGGAVGAVAHENDDGDELAGVPGGRNQRDGKGGGGY